MSAKDAPREVNKDKVFDSPNISSSEEEIEQEVDKEAEERKKRETVDIDGIPIEEKEIKYKAEDIKKKKKMNYFVNVEGAEERAKAEAKRKEAAARAAEKQAEDEKKAAEKQKKEEQAAADKKLADEKKQLDEVNAYIKKHKKQKKLSAEDQERLRKRRGLILKLSGIALGLIIVVVVVAVIVVNKIQEDERLRAEEASEAAISEAIAKDPYMIARIQLDNDRDILNYFENYQFDDIDRVYENFVEEIQNEDDKGRLFIDKMQRLLRYSPDEYDRILEAAERAYVYAPRNVEVVQNVVYAYNYVGQTEKANDLQRVLDLLFEEELNSGKYNSGEDGEVHAG